jgi:hypothetical protein
MRRSISVCEPASCLAGQILTWNFHHTTAQTLPKGARLRFDPDSRGREIDWTVPTTELKRSGHVIYMTLPSGEVLGAKAVDLPSRSGPVFDFILPKEIKATTTLTITMGSYQGSGKELPESEIAAQTFTQRRRTFFLYIDTKGKTSFDSPDEFNLDVKGNTLQLIRVLTPAFVTRGKRFDITIRFEDLFGNLTGYAPEDTLIELSYEHLRENLNWKLFVPETGFITLPNLYFNEPGTYRIQLKNTSTHELAFSAPIRCFQEDSAQLLWGLLHGESEKIDILEEPETALRHFRDEACFNFFASSCFSQENQTSSESWKNVGNSISEFNEEDRFSTLLGFQWTGAHAKEGSRLIVHSKDAKPLLRSDDIKTNSLKKLYKSLNPKENLSVIIFPMSPKNGCDFTDFDPQFERLAEIYNAWGSSECTHKEGNLYSISSAPGKVSEWPQGSLHAALHAGCRFGFVAGGLDDRATFSDYFDSKQVQYTPGLTAVIAKIHSRESLFEAFYQRHCFATTGERILLDFMICNQPMGSEIDAVQKPGLVVNRYLHGFVAGTQSLSKIEVIRCGKVWKTITFTQPTLNYELILDDMDHPEDCTISSGERPFLYYYLRVSQEGGHMAWSSPIWIDFDKDQLVRAIVEKPAKIIKEIKDTKEIKPKAKKI